MYKQLIIVRKDLQCSFGKMSAQISHASMAFLTRMIQKNAIKVDENRYAAWEDKEEGEPQLYKRSDLHTWAKEARGRGEDYFYAKPVAPTNPYGELELCEPNHHYQVNMSIDKDLYEQWIGGIFTKIVCEAKNKNQLMKAVKIAEEMGMKENEDFFIIKDCCLTELTPEEFDENGVGRTITCIGFKPMEAEKIEKISKKFQLMK